MKPSRMFAVLRQCGAASRLLPEIDRLYGMSQNAQHLLDLESGAGIHVMMALDHAAARGYGLTTRYAVVMRDAGHRRLKAPKACRELAALVAREHAHIHRALELDADALVRLLERCDAIRKPERFAEVLQACEAEFCGRAGFEKAPYPQAEHLRQRLRAARSVDAAKIAAMYPNAPAAIKAAVHQARVAAVQSENLSTNLLRECYAASGGALNAHIFHICSASCAPSSLPSARSLRFVDRFLQTLRPVSGRKCKIQRALIDAAAKSDHFV